MDSLFGLGGGSRRRPTSPSSPILEPNIYRWHPSNTTPMPGRISANNTRLASVTHLYVSTKGDDGQSNADWLSEVCANMYDLSIESVDDANNYAQFRVTAVTSGTDSYDFTVTYLAGSGDLVGDGPVFFEILPVPNAILTAKGDLLTHNGTTPVKRAVGIDGQVLVSDASQTSGLNWLTFQAMWFGTGKDSSSTLGANTVLGNRASLSVNYTTLDLVTFTLRGFQLNSGTVDPSHVFCISVLLTGNGGSLLPGVGPLNPGGAARVQGGSSGAGGTANGQQIGLFVYARKVSGTLTIDGRGMVGGDGGNASGVATGTQAGANGVIGTVTNYFLSSAVSSGSSILPGGGGAAGGTAGAASPAPGVGDQVIRSDTFQMILAVRTTSLATETNGTIFTRYVRGPGPNSGASGGIATTSASGGGGGAGAYSFANASGTAGGAGGAGGVGGGAGGGGGAAGGSGCYGCVVVGEFAAAANFTVNYDGGHGGNGGNGVTNGGGGGGGAGGTGGVVHCIFPVNYTAVTTSVTAAGGTKGTGGALAGAGSVGNNGNDGGTGQAYVMTWFG